MLPPDVSEIFVAEKEGSKECALQTILDYVVKKLGLVDSWYSDAIHICKPRRHCRSIFLPKVAFQHSNKRKEPVKREDESHIADFCTL
jgi:hypothetical protein